MAKLRKTKSLARHEFGILNSPFVGDDWICIREKGEFTVYLPRRTAVSLAKFILDHDDAQRREEELEAVFRAAEAEVLGPVGSHPADPVTGYRW